MQEFEQIKREREALQKKKEETREKEDKQKLHINPLLNNQRDDDNMNFSLQKRWFEDTVFKNQAKINQD